MTEVVSIRKVVPGETVSLAKDFEGLKQIRVRLSWDERQTSGEDLDLDVSAFLVDKDRKILETEVYFDPTAKTPKWSLTKVDGWELGKRKGPNFIFYGNRVSPGGAVTLTEDMRTGGEEIILIDLSKLPAEAHEVPFIVTIDGAEGKKQNFGQVNNALIEFFDHETGKKMFEIDLDEEHGIDTGVHTFSAIRNSKTGLWNVKNVDAGHKQGLDFFAGFYGLTATK